MKGLLLHILLSFSVTSVSAQYYLRGEVIDNKKKPLPYAKIFVHSTKMIYYSGANSGDFGIVVRVKTDTLTVTLDGYEKTTIAVKTDQWQKIILKSTADAVSKSLTKLISFTKDMDQHSNRQLFATDETYFQLVENSSIDAALYPSTGYSLNVNKASYSNVRRFIKMNSFVPTDAVRTEEMVNYFNLGYREPPKDSAFVMDARLTDCPWNRQQQLFMLNVSARKLNLEKVPPGNFVFLVDVSGSMDMPNRLPLLKAAFQLFVKNLRDADTVSIVTYGGYVQLYLTPTSGGEKEKILKAIEALEAEGDTPGESAIRMAYQVAKRGFIKGGNNRVILATDGDFNVGETSEQALDNLISSQRQSGVYLTCLGVGMGNFKDSKLQTLAKKGNGNYAYLDDIHEAERVLVTELTQTFYSVADDASVNITFNPDFVKTYRLVGFDNKKEALADTLNNLEGGEVGSGSNILALFEITPTDKNLAMSKAGTSIELFQADVKYSLNQDEINKKLHYHPSLKYISLTSLEKEYKFATTVALFGLKLKKSEYAKNITWPMLKILAKASCNEGNYLQKEFLNLLDKAIKLYSGKKKED